MALVAYDNSDTSEYEDEDDLPSGPDSAAIIDVNIKVSAPSSSEGSIANSTLEASTDVGRSLFNLLPQPSSKKTVVVEEDDDEFLHKKATAPNIVKPKARIMVPSLSDFKDVEYSASSKPKVPSSKKCGLLSLLPQPKGTVLATKSSKPMIPHVLTQHTSKAPIKTTLPIPAQIKQTTTVANKLAIDYSDESDNEEDVQNDFFSINSKPDIPIEDTPLDIETNIQPLRTESKITAGNSQKLPRNVESYFKQNEVHNSLDQPEELEYPESQSSSSYGGSSSYGSVVHNGAGSSNDIGLDEEAIRQLCGTRGKRKREEIQIVDVNQQEVLAEAQEWFRKGLMEDTTKRVSASKKKGNEPTNQQRKKHQITYLAHQAKANEAELQNQWANNRNNKRQAASKYGF